MPHVIGMFCGLRNVLSEEWVQRILGTFSSRPHFGADRIAWKKDIKGVFFFPVKLVYLYLLGHACNHGYRKVEIESDSRDAIQCITRVDSQRIDSSLIIVICEMLGRDWEIDLAYVPREINIVIDRITSTICGKSIGDSLF
ncbi:hypothetical protein GQ457_15G003340 [Hibiscus cannabinus]